MFFNEPVQNVFMTKYYSAKDLNPRPLFAGEGVGGEVFTKEYLVISFFLDSLNNH